MIYRKKNLDHIESHAPERLLSHAIAAYWMSNETVFGSASSNAALQRKASMPLRRAFLTACCLQFSIAAVVSQVVAAEGEAQKRSSFEYVDEKPDGSKRYRRPNLDADPMELSVEELRARIVNLEERLEALENAGRNRRGAAR